MHVPPLKRIKKPQKVGEAVTLIGAREDPHLNGVRERAGNGKSVNARIKATTMLVPISINGDPC